MDKFAERIGLYDLWVTFFPGIISSIELLIIRGVYKNQLILSFSYIPSETHVWLVIVLCSLFIGVILQEIGRFIRKVFKLRNAATGLLDKSIGIFSQYEINSIKDYCNKNRLNTTDSKSVFHIINTQAINNNIADKYVKLSVLQNMSLSLAVTRIFGAIGWTYLFIYSLTQKSYDKAAFFFCITIICILLTILFLKRSERFNRYWVRNIVFAVSLINSGE